MPDGMFEHGNWTMENVYWNLYGATGIGGRAIMPYVLNFFACFYGYEILCDKMTCTGISCQIGTKLRVWAVGQAGARGQLILLRSIVLHP